MSAPSTLTPRLLTTLIMSLIRNPADTLVPLPPDLAILLGIPTQKRVNKIRSADLICQAIRCLQVSGEIPDLDRK